MIRFQTNLESVVALWLMVTWMVPGGAAADPLDQENRVEIEVKPADDYTVVPVGERGVVVVGSPKVKKGTEVAIALFDTEFNQVWTEELLLDKKQEYQAHALDGDQLLLIFMKTRKPQWTVIQCDLEDGEAVVRVVEAPFKVNGIEEMTVAGDDVYVAGNTNKGDVLLHHRRGEEEAGEVPIDDATGKGKNLDIQRLMAVRGGNEADLELVKTHKGKPRIAVLGLADGAIERPVLFGEFPGENYPRSAQRLELSDGTELIIGAYADRERQKGSQGLYVSQWDGGELDFIEYTSFSELENFFGYLSERRQERLEKKAERKQAKGSDLNLDIRLDVHDIIEQGDRYLMVAEAYYPEYYTYSTTTTSVVNGVATTNTTTYTVFVGWRYTHAIVVAMDREGHVLWDNCLKIGNVLHKKRKHNVKVAVEGERVVMFYNYTGSIYTTVVDGDEVIDDREEVDHETIEEDESIRKSWESSSAYWYERNFLLWGIHKVKDPGEGKRRVFYFSKVSAR